MILKNSFFKLVREDFKRRKVELFLSVIAFALLFLLVPLLVLPVQQQDFSSVNGNTLMRFLFGIQEPLVYAVTFGGALICAIHSMSYLFSKQKTDFYHSLPVRRELLFFSSYINSILLYAVPYLVTLLIGLLVSQVNFSYPAELLCEIFQAFFYHILGYCMFLNLNLVIVMLSGRLLVALLGVAATNIYGLFWLVILDFYRGEFLFCLPEKRASVLDVEVLSPVCNYAMRGFAGTRSGKYGLLWLMAVVAVLSLGIALFLYKGRSSCTSGETLAFPKLKPILKGMVMLPVSLLGGIFMYMAYQSMTFWVIGVCVTLVVCHVALQGILEHGNIRALRKGLVTQGIVLVAALAVGAGYRFDIFGVNTYLPKEQTVKSYSIIFSGDYNGKWNYDSASETYRGKHMEITDGELMRSMAELGYACRKKWTYGQEENAQANRCDFHILFHLKNGKNIERVYTIDGSSEENKEICEQLLNNTQFKLSKKIFDMDMKKDSLLLHGMGEDGEEQTITLNKQQQEELLGAIRADVMNSQAKDRMEDAQIGSLLIRNPYSQDMQEPILSSYKETIKFMKTLGLQTDKKE